MNKKTKHQNHFPMTFPDMAPDCNDYLLPPASDGVRIERSGDVGMLRDEETGAEVYRFRWEMRS